MALPRCNETTRSPPKTKVGDLFTNTDGDTGVVVKYHNSRKVEVVFIDTMYETTACAINIREGKVKDKLKPSVHGVGFIGDGKFNSKYVSYPSWISMLERCYDFKFQQRSPTYIGCTVCEEWHNFQNYTEWYNKAHPSDGNKYQLDKDIRVSGNKIYSPDTCIFVTASENLINAFAKDYTFIDPDGKLVEIYNLSSFCRSNGLHQGSMSRVSRGRLKQHKGWTNTN